LYFPPWGGDIVAYLILGAVAATLILELIKNWGKLTVSSCAKFYGSLILGTMGQALFDNKPLRFTVWAVIVLGLMFFVTLILAYHKNIAFA